MDPKSTRSCRLEVFCQKSALKKLAKFTGKHLCQSLFYNKVENLSSLTLLKKTLRHRCFPVGFPKFLITPFPYRTPPMAAFAPIHCQWKLCSKILDILKKSFFIKDFAGNFQAVTWKLWWKWVSRKVFQRFFDHKSESHTKKLFVKRTKLKVYFPNNNPIILHAG